MADLVAVLQSLPAAQLLAILPTLEREELETISAQCNGSLPPFVRAELNRLLAAALPMGPPSECRLARAQAIVMMNRHNASPPQSLWNPRDKIRQEAPDGAERVVTRKRNGSDVFGVIREAEAPADDTDTCYRDEIMADLMAWRAERK